LRNAEPEKWSTVSGGAIKTSSKQPLADLMAEEDPEK
jgi:hypothetical protein